MSTPKLSVVIPCYNHGIYVQDAIDSVEASTYKSYEIIIVNDGSTDTLTTEKMDELMQRGYHVINQLNQGLARTRNNGIAAASGEYIMPLDADNKIRSTYIEKAVSVLNSHPEIGVVYGECARFGGDNTISYGSGGDPFDPVRLYRENYIDALAVFSKSDWEKVGGYDVNMPAMGIEDWDFWMTLHESGVRFHFINEILFDYRVVPGSMISKLSASEKIAKVVRYMAIKHGPAYREKFIESESELNYAKSKPLSFFLKHRFPSLYNAYMNAKS